MGVKAAPWLDIFSGGLEQRAVGVLAANYTIDRTTLRGGFSTGRVFNTPETIAKYSIFTAEGGFKYQFGPTVSIIRVGSVDEAVTVANDNEYALSSAVFGRDVGRAMAVAARVESGICHINAATVADEPQMPFGGMKASGYGRFGGRAAIDEFTETRWITVSELPRQYPI